MNGKNDGRPGQGHRHAINPTNQLDAITRGEGTVVLPRDRDALDALIERLDPMVHEALGAPGPVAETIENARTVLALAKIEVRKRRAAEIAEQLASINELVRGAA